MTDQAVERSAGRQQSFLQSEADLVVIALGLGHEHPTTTLAYLEADLAMKEQTLARVDASRSSLSR